MGPDSVMYTFPCHTGGGVYGACIAVCLGLQPLFAGVFSIALAISDVDSFGRSGLKSSVRA